MKELVDRVRIDASAEHVFEALVNESGLRSWVSATASCDDATGNWQGRLDDMPATRWKVIELTKPLTLIWRCEAGPSEVVGSVVRVRLSDIGEYRTLLELVHADWPLVANGVDEWNTVWGALLHHLKNYAETEMGDPAYD